MPEGAKIRSLDIYYDDIIRGFQFLDKEGKIVFEIGYTPGHFANNSVMLAENEVIVGVVAYLVPGFQTTYNNF